MKDGSADSQVSPATRAGADAGAPARPGFSLGALLRARGAWALADQGVVSLGNFLTAVVLARTLPLGDTGIFALVFGMLLFLNSLHQALVTYPLSVRGAASDGDRLRDLAGSSLLCTLLLALPLSLGVIIIVGLSSRASLIPWAIAAMLLWQFQETLRRGIMAHLRHREALVGDALRYLGQASVLWLLASRGLLTLERTFVVIAATSLLAIVVQAMQLRPVLLVRRQVLALFREHWTLGRWVLLTGLVTIVTVQAMPWVLAYFHGNAEVARFWVLGQIMGVTNPVIISMAGLIVPAASAALAGSGDLRGAAKKVGLGFGLQGAVLLVPFFLFVFVMPQLALRVFARDNGAYLDLTTHLRLFVIAYFLTFPGHVMLALLNGLSRPRLAFVAQCAFSATTLLVSLPLAAAFGLTGAVWGGLVPAAAYATATFYMLRRASAEPERRGFEPLPPRAESNPHPERSIHLAPAAAPAAARASELDAEGAVA